MPGAEELTRFKTEAKAIARLRHANIVAVYEVGEHDGKPFFSLEFCEGGSLDKTLARNPLPPEKAAELAEVLAHAMQAAHEAQVIHRDLKPANVLLTADGAVKITDFGLAKSLDESGQTHTGDILGTPSYMAPEQAEGRKDIGPATDVYALGAILYEMLAGRPPFKAATTVDTILQVIRDEPVPPRRLNALVPIDLETITLKCLQKDPKRRYASARNLAEDLRRWGAGEPIAARPASVYERASKWMRRRPTLALLLGGSLLGLLALLSLGVLFTVWLADERSVAVGARLEAEKERNVAVAARQDEETQRSKAEESVRQEVLARKQAENEKRKADVARDHAEMLGYSGQLALALRGVGGGRCPSWPGCHLSRCRWDIRGLGASLPVLPLQPGPPDARRAR